MKYMLMLFEKPTDWESLPEEEVAAALAEHEKFAEFLTERGISASGEALRSAWTATTLRPSGDDMLVTDGPYMELKEHLGGFYIIDVKDLDEALEVAKRCPTGTATEVRPIWEMPS